MKYKLLATDMDGTLLNDDVLISERTKKALEEAYSKGIKIVFATGRLYISAAKYAEGLSFDMPIISSNGAIMTDEKDKVIYENVLPDEIIREVTKVMDEMDIYYHLYTMDSVYSKSIDKDFLMRYYSDGNGKLEVNTYEFDDIDDILGKGTGFSKILSSDTDYDHLDELESRLRENFDNVEITKSWIDNVEVMNKGVSKAVALKEICEKLNIKPEEVITVGDNENDLPMLEFAGKGVAMGNGVKLAKENADEITDTNQNDGLAKVIEQYLL